MSLVIWPRPHRYLGSLQTYFSDVGDLLNATGNPILLGGANSTNPVADDPTAAALIAALRGPVDALASKPAGVWPCCARG
jgi:hypothetical protein